MKEMTVKEFQAQELKKAKKKVKIEGYLEPFCEDEGVLVELAGGDKESVDEYTFYCTLDHKDRFKLYGCCESGYRSTLIGTFNKIDPDRKEAKTKVLTKEIRRVYEEARSTGSVDDMDELHHCIKELEAHIGEEE